VQTLVSLSGSGFFFAAKYHKGLRIKSYFFLSFTSLNIDVAVATMPATSDRFDGRIMVLFVFARFANPLRYCSAILRFTAFSPFSSEMAFAMALNPFAVALATCSISEARPAASLIRFCFSPSDFRIYSCLSPSALLILACLVPSGSTSRA